MLRDVDVLPAGPNWLSHTFVLEGARHTYVFHAFKRDLIQVVRELIGDPKLKWAIHYAPQRHWTWSRTQYILEQELDEAGTIAALIVSSDKSCVSTVLNGKHVYPVYVTGRVFPGRAKGRQIPSTPAIRSPRDEGVDEAAEGGMANRG